jgi:hypothetical protein
MRPLLCPGIPLLSILAPPKLLERGQSYFSERESALLAPRKGHLNSNRTLVGPHQLNVH